MTKQTKTTTHDPQKLREQAERGRQADEFTQNPLWTEAIDILKEEIETAWKNSSGMDREAREEAYRLYRTTLRLEGILKQIMISGRNARSLLDLEENRGGGGT